MKALSILQPYAWLIVRPDIVDPDQRRIAYEGDIIKPIENRSWYSAYQGEFLVHAGKSYSRRTHAQYANDLAERFGILLPGFDDMPLGGIVGKVSMTGCQREHHSRWKEAGSWGFLLADAQPLPFIPWRGQLGFFQVPTSALQKVGAA